MSTEQVVVQLEFRLDLIGRLIVLSLLGKSHGVDIGVLVITEFRVRGAEHMVVVVEVLTIDVLLIDREVWHFLVSDTEELAVVLMVFRIGHVEVGDNLDTVADEIVESSTSGESVELLLDDGTSLMVITSCDTEVGLLTTTREAHIVFLLPTSLTNGLAPVCVVVVHLIFVPRLVIVELPDVGCLIGKSRVVISLLHEHGVLVTVEQADSLRLESGHGAVRVLHLGLSSATTLGLDFDDTVCTL